VEYPESAAKECKPKAANGNQSKQSPKDPADKNRRVKAQARKILNALASPEVELSILGGRRADRRDERGIPRPSGSDQRHLLSHAGRRIRPDQPRPAGDVVISVEYIERQAAESDTRPKKCWTSI
jgi:hypothetical protein